MFVVSSWLLVCVWYFGFCFGLGCNKRENWRKEKVENAKRFRDTLSFPPYLAPLTCPRFPTSVGDEGDKGEGVAGH